MADITGSENAPAEEQEQENADFDAAFSERITAGREEAEPEAEKPEGKEQAPAGDAEGAQQPDKKEECSKEFDPFSGLSEEQERYFRSLHQSESSQRGRVSALQKKVNGYEAAAKQPPAQQKADEGGDQQQQQPSRAEKLRQAKEEYPDAVGDLVEEVMELREKLDGMTPKAPEEGPEPDEATQAREYQALEEKHRDYREIAADPEFHKWIADQSQGVQNLANSYAASDVSSVLSLFKAERQAAQPKNPPAQAETDTTANKRQRQLQGSQAVSSRGAPAASGVPDDFDAAFEARAKARTR